MLRCHVVGILLAIAVVGPPLASQAQPANGDSDYNYITTIRTAAPPAVVSGATIVQMSPNGAMRTLQTGSNGFTCMVVGPGDAMCADANAMQWAHAYLTHATPPNVTGFVYMLAGDNGASNTDPYATAATSDNHWVKTGPHVMIVGPAASAMGYPATPDADPTKPYVMWANTPYAHLMIPVTASPQ